MAWVPVFPETLMMLLRPQLRSVQVHAIAHVGEGEHITRMNGAYGPIPRLGRKANKQKGNGNISAIHNSNSMIATALNPIPVAEVQDLERLILPHALPPPQSPRLGLKVALPIKVPEICAARIGAGA